MLVMKLQSERDVSHEVAEEEGWVVMKTHDVAEGE